MKKSSFTKEESLALKAVAVLLLIMYHSLKGSDYEGFMLNFFPLTESQVNHIGVYCKICVGIFAFISGYGISKKYRNSEKTISQKAFSQYISSIKAFWPVFIICILATAAIDGRPFTVYAGQFPLHSVVNLLIDGLGLAKLMGTPTLVSSWWYLSAMAVFTFAVPLLQKAVRRIGWIAPFFALIAFPRLVGMGYLPGGDVMPFYFLMPVLLGVIFAEYDLFERLDDFRPMKEERETLNRVVRLGMVTVALLISYKFFHLLPRDIFWEYHYAFAPLVFILFFREGYAFFPWLKRPLAWLGKHSGNIYFVHALLLRYYLRDFLFSMPWFMLTPLATYAVSLAFSVAVEAGKVGVTNRISGKCDFLFQTHPDTSWSQKQRSGFWMWNLFWVLVSGFVLGLFALILAPGPSNTDIAKSLLQNPAIVALNTLPVVFLNLILYVLIRQAWLAFSLNTILVLGLSVVNYFKIMIRDDPLMFTDLFLFKEAQNIIGKGDYKLFLDSQLIVVAICAVTIAAFLYFLVRGRPQRMRAMFGTTLLIGILGLTLLTPTLMNTDVYRNIYDRSWEPTKDYISHGFVYSFIHSITDMIETPPPGYNEEGMATLLKAYPEADIPDEKKVNIIAVMLEAYNDFSKFDVPGLSPDVYRVWHDLEEEGYSGDLVTNIFAGGTTDTERCFLTGYLKGYNFRSSINAYPWYFRSQGYRVEGFHPYYRWYYNRENVTSFLGFENYYFNDDIGTFATNPWTSDGVLFDEILKAFQAETASGQPYFSYSLSFQGHNPYVPGEYDWGNVCVTEDGIYTEEQRGEMEDYFGSVASTNESLRKFTDSLRADAEPVILILFGDHNPSLRGEIYSAMGINLDTSTEEGFRNYYSTRYIIWANDAAKEILGNDCRGEGPAIGPYFLMNQVFELCGWKGPSYLQALNDISEEVQVVNASGVCMKDGQFVKETDVAANQAITQYRHLEYYQRKQPVDR